MLKYECQVKRCGRMALKVHRVTAHNVIVRMNQTRRVSHWIQVPFIFGGLLVTLWTWKSLSLVVFQNKIIYMPYLGRHEEVKDYRTPGVTWTTSHLKTTDGVTLTLCQSSIHHATHERRTRSDRENVTVVYLQGNASSTPARLPPLSKCLLRLARPDTNVTFWTVSYRGYWTSTGSPSEIGITHDVSAALTHILECQPSDDPGTVVLWGHSIGAFFAVQALDTVMSGKGNKEGRVKLILETPFTSLSAVLQSLYPERWLPYRYLSPFLRSRMDLSLALSRLEAAPALRAVQVMTLRANQDEIVPGHVTDSVNDLIRSRFSTIQEAKVDGLHQDLIFKEETRRCISQFISPQKHKLNSKRY